MRHPRKIHGSFQVRGQTNPYPDAPAKDNTFHGIGHAKDAYRSQAVAAGLDYLVSRAGGCACWMDLYDADAWDGVSYGDPYARLELGLRGGIHVSSF